MTSKIAIIGAGAVGTAIAYALMIKGIGRYIYLIDINEKKCRGEVLDLNHGRSFTPGISIKTGTYDDCKNTNIIIITAGAKQKPGETRIELLERNIKIIKEIAGNLNIKGSDNTPIILMVTNPVDILTYFMYKFTGLNRNKVIGSGTVLDSARLRFELSEHCEINANNIHGYVIGEHGDSEVILWSSIRIGINKFEEFCETCGRGPRFGKNREECRTNTRLIIEKNVKNAAYEIIEAKGYTNYAIGLAVARIVDAILGDRNSIMPVSTVLDGEFGVKNVAIGIPCVLNANGIRSRILPEMSTEENQKFMSGIKKLKNIIEDIGKNPELR